MAFSLANLTSLVKVALQHNASDIHIRMKEPPCLRLRGELVPIQTKSFSKEDIIDICQIFFGHDPAFKNIDKLKEYDGGYTIKDVCRLRFNFFHYHESLGIILRLVKGKIPTIEEIGVAPICKKIAEFKRGLVLVTGATGSGKSTTLAAMIDHINHVRASHIVTIEDPIEYVHPQIKSRISQREVGTDTASFNDGMRAALRQDPDIILIGEMRDPITVSTALKAAETGHLVLSTVHTTDATSTIGRLLGLFPPEEADDVRKRLSENLYSTISQRMLKGVQKGKVHIAQEIMITTPGVKDCILGKEPLARLHKIIEENHKAGGNGSQSFEQSVMALFDKGHITKEVAMSAVDSQADFMQKLLVN